MHHVCKWDVIEIKCIRKNNRDADDYIVHSTSPVKIYHVNLCRDGFLMDVLHACLQSSPCMKWHAYKHCTLNALYKGCQIDIVIQTYKLKH